MLRLPDNLLPGDVAGRSLAQLRQGKCFLRNANETGIIIIRSMHVHKPNGSRSTMKFAFVKNAEKKPAVPKGNSFAVYISAVSCASWYL